LGKTKQTTRRRSAVKPVTWDTVRQLALALPGVEEGTSYGTPAFKVKGKLLARFHQDGESMVVKIEYGSCLGVDSPKQKRVRNTVSSSSEYKL
jgi:hypothetical protein